MTRPVSNFESQPRIIPGWWWRRLPFLNISATLAGQGECFLNSPTACSSCWRPEDGVLSASLESIAHSFVTVCTWPQVTETPILLNLPYSFGTLPGCCNRDSSRSSISLNLSTLCQAIAFSLSSPDKPPCRYCCSQRVMVFASQALSQLWC